MVDKWHYSKAGSDEKLGPIDTVELKAMASDGRLSPDDLIWKEGMPEWTPASKAKGLFPAQTPASIPPPLPVSAGTQKKTTGSWRRTLSDLLARKPKWVYAAGGGILLVVTIVLAMAFSGDSGAAGTQPVRRTDTVLPGDAQTQPVRRTETASPDDATEKTLARQRAADDEWKPALLAKLNRKVTLEFVETPLSEALMFLQTLTKMAIVIDPSAYKNFADTPIIFRATSMPLSTALRQILQQADLEYDLIDGVVLVATPQGLAEVRRKEALEDARAGRLAGPSKTLDCGGGVTMDLVLIPAGEFVMGSPTSEIRRDGNEIQHRVRITKPFYMGKYEVTQAQYQQVMGSDPSHFKDASKPVEQVSWDDAIAFCRKLSQRTGKTVRLPTEAEWEYACRAGSTTRFSFGDSDNGLASYAWYGRNSGDSTHAVGGRRANAWGLHDMHGNVSEWCADWIGARYYANSPRENPTGPASGRLRALRGGSWMMFCHGCRSACRHTHEPTFRFSAIGFRVVVLPSPGL